jgi:transcriptional regulator with XRE-family HTH domain
MARYGETKPDLDPHNTKRLIGARIREARNAAGMTNTELEQLMTANGHNWRSGIASKVITGRHRKVLIEELVTLADIFDMPLGYFTQDLPAAGITSPKVDVEDVSKAEETGISHADKMPWRYGAPGHKARIYQLAERLGIDPAAVQRRLDAIALPALEQYVDELGQRLGEGASDE